MMRSFDVQANIDAACVFLREYLASSGQQRYVTGLSGGIDSAAVAFLAARAVGVERLVLVRMPYGLTVKSEHPSSTPASLADAQRVVDALDGVPNVTVDVAPMVDAAAASLATAARSLQQWGMADCWSDIESPVNAPILGNLKARSRAVVLRGFANQYKGLVLGTENFTEHMVGYFTIGGDEESDIEVLSPFVKQEVRALARALGVPQAILDKAPSADLWTGHTDEGELGVSYAEMDLVVVAGQGLDDPAGRHAYEELPKTTGLPAPVVHRVLDRIRATEFKRAKKPTFAGRFAQEGSAMTTTSRRPRVGYLVDVQNDFMRSALPGGRLYVRHLQDPDDAGAEQIIPALARLARWMYERCDAVILSGDWHGPEDAEIDAAAPDFRATYPPHCMGRSTDAAECAGAELIPEVTPPRGSIVLPWDATPEIAARVATEAKEQGLPVFVQKTQFSVWTGNPAMDAFANELTDRLHARPEIILAGVASDVCDDQAIRGFLARGYPVTVVRDAIHSLGSQPDDAILAGWEALGARTTTLAALEAELPSPATTMGVR